VFEHLFCNERLDCNELFLISSSAAARYATWVAEVLVVLLANLMALASLFARFRRAWSRGVLIAFTLASIPASLMIAVEVAYFFWGSRWTSPFWLLVAIPLWSFPLWVTFRKRPPGAPPLGAPLTNETARK
jgi:hypothetical protein